MEDQTLQPMLTMYSEYYRDFMVLMSEYKDRIDAIRKIFKTEFTTLLEDQETLDSQMELLSKDFWLFSQRYVKWIQILKLDLFLRKMEREMSWLEEEEEEIEYLIMRVARIEDH